MGVERVHSPEDPRVAAYRGVRDGELLRSSGLFVAEGRHIVQRVAGNGRYRVHSLLVNDAALNGLEPALERLDASVPILVAEPKVLSAIAGYDVHRGCLALVHRPPPVPVGVLAETGG
jgi:tRNA G18 (ribose-2'-O)-methylase SpoU